MIEIKEILDNASGVEYFKSGDVIIEDGDIDGDKMYILLSGTADVYKNYGQLGEVKIATLVSGDYFGEMSLFLSRARTATVVAAEDITALAVDHSNALAFFRSHPEATFSLIQSLCARLGETNVNIADSTVKYVKNVNRLSEEKERFKTAANTDALTGVFNRRYFMQSAADMAQNAAGREQTVYVAIIDLDFFKKINDTYGHQAGDETLKTAAKTISDALRENDLFARYGGEEFIALLTGVNEDTVQILLERVRQNVQDAVIQFEGTDIHITASFGAAPVTASDGLDAAIARADEALYDAKENGRNRVVIRLRED